MSHRLALAEAMLRREPEAAVPEEVRPSRGSSERPSTGGHGRDAMPPVKEHYKPAPPLRYSGDDSKVRVELWLRSMMSYLQLTNTQPSRWALVAESYLAGIAQTVWNSARDGLQDAPTWTNLSDCLLKHFADRYAAQKLLRQLDTFAVEGGLSTVSVQAVMRSVTTALEQFDATPGVTQMDMGTKCGHMRAALRRGWPATGTAGSEEGDKARALARKLNTAFDDRKVAHELDAMVDYVVRHAPSVEDAEAIKAKRGGGGGSGGGGGGGGGPPSGGSHRDKGRSPAADRNGNGKRPHDGDGRPGKNRGPSASWGSRGGNGGGGSEKSAGHKGRGPNHAGGDTWVTDDVKRARLLHRDVCWKCEQTGHLGSHCINKGKPQLGEAYKKPPAGR